MYIRWRISFHITAYSGVNRGGASSVYVLDRPWSGEPNPTIIVQADSLPEAYSISKHVMLGIKMDERVCDCEVISITPDTDEISLPISSRQSEHRGVSNT